jgi:hypothetical protein
MKKNTVIIGEMIKIEGRLQRHEIVKKVVNTFIETEYNKKAKGVKFEYPVENLSNGQQLFIGRPGHKKNFDFEVKVPSNIGLGKGTHIEIATDLRNKKQENEQKFENLLNAITQIYDCSENDVDRILSNYPDLNNSFQTGAQVSIILKVLKWLFIMEDIIYWDNEGRAFLFNFFKYIIDNNSVQTELEKVKNSPEELKRAMKKCGIEWRLSEG